LVVATVTGQMDMFGGPDVPVQRKAAPAADQPVTDDPDLIASVVRAAGDPGYVVIGPAQRVYRRGVGGRSDEIEAAPLYENGAVHQLLTKGLLKIGGSHVVNHQGKSGGANSVLVPAKTRSMVSRWDSYKRPDSFGPTRYAESPSQK
jgi:hypothetical protein